VNRLEREIAPIGIDNEVAVLKRDMDLIRTLLLRIENDPQFNGEACQVRPNEPSDLGIIDHSYAEVAYQLILLMDDL
jgi:hypothetical protein